MTCDCLNDCGDDPWLKDGSGRAQPCDKLLARQEHARVISERLATINALRANYGADNVFELIELMHAEVVRLDAVQRSLFSQHAAKAKPAQEPLTDVEIERALVAWFAPGDDFRARMRAAIYAAAGVQLPQVEGGPG
jgi:hypothetical protein